MASNRNRVALVGKIGCGKTTLMQRLSDDPIEYLKTQMVTYTDRFIDTPGEFIEMPFFTRQAINVTCDSGLLLVLVSATDWQNTIPPNFVHTYNIPFMGVVTKIDHPKADIKRARRFLEYAGIRPHLIAEVSAITGEGIEDLQNRIADLIKKTTPTKRNRR